MEPQYVLSLGTMCACMFLNSSSTPQSCSWVVVYLNSHSVLLTFHRHWRAQYSSQGASPFPEKNVIMASPQPSPPILSPSSLYSLPPMTFCCPTTSSGFPQTKPFKGHFCVRLPPSWGVNGWICLDESAFVVCNKWMEARQGGRESMTELLEDTMLEMTLFYVFINEL